MSEYKPNSHKYRDEQKELANTNERKIEKVVSNGNVKIKKKSGIYKVADIFISDDARNLKSYIIEEWAVPTIKKMLLGSLDMILNGGNGGYDRRSSVNSNVSYRRYYDDRKDDRRYNGDSRERTRFDYDNIVFHSRGDAEAVLDEMSNVIERYGFVTVADVYDMADTTPPSYTSNRYGWTNLRNADVVRDRDGYIIKLPRAMPID